MFIRKKKGVIRIDCSIISNKSTDNRRQTATMFHGGEPPSSNSLANLWLGTDRSVERSCSRLDVRRLDLAIKSRNCQIGNFSRNAVVEPMTLRYGESANSMPNAQLQSVQRLGLISRWGATEIMRLSQKGDENTLFAGVLTILFPVCVIASSSKVWRLFSSVLILQSANGVLDVAIATASCSESVAFGEKASLPFRMPTDFNTFGTRIARRSQASKIRQIFGESCQLVVQSEITSVGQIDDPHPHDSPAPQRG